MNKNLRTTILLTLVIFIMSACSSSTENIADTNEIIEINQEIPVYDFNDLEPLLYQNSNKITLVNFWAMWCVPCVEELPFIQEYVNNNPDIDLLLVSMDFVENKDTKLKDFLKKNKITSKVVLLDDPDSNTWIDKINPAWSGAIPYTIMFNNDERFYYERAFESITDLENEINNNFKNK